MKVHSVRSKQISEQCNNKAFSITITITITIKTKTHTIYVMNSIFLILKYHFTLKTCSLITKESRKVRNINELLAHGKIRTQTKRKIVPNFMKHQHIFSVA